MAKKTKTGGLSEYWFPWYPGRFKADTMHLTALQDGIYRRLIDHYMETKTALPDNDVALARIAGVTPDMFGDNSGIIRGFFIADGAGRLTHKKCGAILKEQDKMSKSYAKRGSLGGKAKAAKAPGNLDLFDGEASNSQAIAKQQPKPNVAHNMTGQDRTLQDRTSNQTLESKNSTLSSEGGRFSIENFLRDEDRESFRRIAPGKDPHFYIREFNERVNSGQFQRPDKPVPAFLAWAKKYLKTDTA